jgi:hypothetical protein
MFISQGACGSVYQKLHKREVKCGEFTVVIPVSIKAPVYMLPALSKLQSKLAHDQRREVIICYVS